MRETTRELMASLKVQLDLLKLVAGAEEGQPQRIPVENDARTIEQFVRAANPRAV